jgi:hypothetical protein
VTVDEYTGVREHVEVELRNLEGHLRVLADGPELLVRSGSHTALDRGGKSVACTGPTSECARLGRACTYLAGLRVILWGVFEQRLA